MLIIVLDSKCAQKLIYGIKSLGFIGLLGLKLQITEVEKSSILKCFIQSVSTGSSLCPKTCST